MNLFHLFLLLSVIAVWGINFVAIKTGLIGLPPIFLCFTRFLFCLPALLFVKRPPVSFKLIATYSLLMFVLQFSVLFIAMRSGISAGLASVLLQFQSFFAIAFAVLFMGEKYHLWQGAGALVSLLGLVLIAAHVGGDVTPSGLILVLIASVMWAAGSVLAKKMKGSAFSLVVWSSLLACPPLLILSFSLRGSGNDRRIHPQSLLDPLRRCFLYRPHIDPFRLRHLELAPPTLPSDQTFSFYSFGPYRRDVEFRLFFRRRAPLVENCRSGIDCGWSRH